MNCWLKVELLLITSFTQCRLSCSLAVDHKVFEASQYQSG